LLFCSLCHLINESENNKENDDVKEENSNNGNSTEVIVVSPVPDSDAGAIANLTDRSSIDKITKVDILLNATGNVPIMKKSHKDSRTVVMEVEIR